MTAICADELLRDDDRRTRRSEVRTRSRASASRATDPLAATRPLRYEDFERRSDALSDLLGGRLFPRRI